jgi:hypothetical protein
VNASFLQPVNPDFGEQMSDADPVQTGAVTMQDGSVRHYVPPGSIADQLGLDHVPLTQAMSEGTAATSDQRNWGSMGAANEPSMTNKAGI